MIEAGQPKGVDQPETFEFTPENLRRAEGAVGKYPEGKHQSAIMELLHIAQEQHGWLPTAAIVYCADMLGMPHIRAFEVASFYTLYRRRPVGKHHIQVCTSVSCCLRGGDDLLHVCKSKLGVGKGDVTEDGLFSVEEVECIGACVNAPAVQINNDTYEDLTVERMVEILDALARGEDVPCGSQTGRQCSCAASGSTMLKGEDDGTR